MTLSDLASIGSLVSGFAVLVSLVYLGVQVRQSERSQRALVQQGRAGRMVDMFIRLAEPATNRTISRFMSGDESVSSDEFSQFRLLFQAMTYSQEDTFLQHKLGLIKDDEFDGFRERMKGFFAAPAARAIWRQTRSSHGAEFRAFLDDVVRESRSTPPSDPMEDWKEALAAEKAISAR
jgi:hypothetical protein